LCCQLDDGTFEMRFPCRPDALIPHLDVNADTGNFTYAVHQMPPGKHYIAGEYLSWPDFAKAWARVTGASVTFKENTFDELVDSIPDRALGIEVALMFVYSSDPGYDGGMEVLKAEDLRKVSACLPNNPILTFANNSPRLASTVLCSQWRSLWPGRSGPIC
jgi:hypothetical protein